MHLLSARHRSEFLAVPELVRLTMAEGSDGPEPTILVKSSTLALKYLIRLKRFRLLFFRIDKNWLAYGVEIADDPLRPATLWSLVEHADEVAALQALSRSPQCFVFLFNELAVNVSWAEVEIDLSRPEVKSLIEPTILHPIAELTATEQVHQRINEFHQGQLTPEVVQVIPVVVSDWRPLESYYVTNRLSSSLISIFETDEGRQQEEIALWLIDNLRPAGAVKNPVVHEKSKPRELSDLVLSHEHGAFLIESKSLAIMLRDNLPDRTKLARNITKHLQKATDQLIGGVKNLRRGHRITDDRGNDVEVERANPPHVIVLVPDLSLLSEATDFGGDFLRRASAESGALFHILDPAELLRMVQAAEMISKRSLSVTPIMAFDYYLLQRAEHTIRLTTPYFHMLLRISDETTSP